MVEVQGSCPATPVTTLPGVHFPDRRKMVKLSAASRIDLLWWTQPQRLSQGIQISDWTLIYMDTRLLSWGAHLEGQVRQGLWTLAEASKSINFLEL